MRICPSSFDCDIPKAYSHGLARQIQRQTQCLVQQADDAHACEQGVASSLCRGTLFVPAVSPHASVHTWAGWWCAILMIRDRQPLKTWKYLKVHGHLCRTLWPPLYISGEMKTRTAE
jgi:hypothetical protein